MTRSRLALRPDDRLFCSSVSLFLRKLLLCWCHGIDDVVPNVSGTIGIVPYWYNMVRYLVGSQRFTPIIVDMLLCDHGKIFKDP